MHLMDPLKTLARLFLLLSVGLIPAAAGTQPDFNSHEAHPDGSLTVRYFAPTAQAVTVNLDYNPHGAALVKDADGVWAYTTGPLPPALHMYGFAVDGVAVFDPLNPDIDPSFFYRTNTVWVRGPAPKPWDVADVPHGVVHHHAYRSSVMVGLKDGVEDYYVYTPPGYEPASSTPYPVLYLLHGWAGGANAWLADGQAQVILDNLIAQGRARPMIVVMPQGYGDMSFVTSGFKVWSDEAAIGRNLGLYSQALLTEILPQVEAGYRASRDPHDRAIAGLSMGGGQSLVIGLSHPEVFAWVGGFSSAVVYNDFASVLPKLGQKDAVLPGLIWIACGTEDDLIASNRHFVAWLRSKGAKPTFAEIPGIHNWPVWRDNLIQFAPLLFRPAAAR
jgi:enterochelin esterase family protein